MSELKPHQLASRHLRKQWEKLTGEIIPPTPLASAVTYAVNAAGYTKSMVDKMIESYRKVQQ